MNHTPTSHAAQAGIDLDKLEALARAANELRETIQPFVSTGGQLVIGTFSMSRAEVDVVARLYDALPPAAVLDLISLARNAACAAPAADERALFEAWSNCVAPAHGFEVDERGQYVEYPVHAGWEAWQARAALAQQAASPAPAAQAVGFTAEYVRMLHAVAGHMRREGSGMCSRDLTSLALRIDAARAASPAPETAQADDCGRCLANGHWCAKDTCSNEATHAQQDAAPTELHIGVSNNDQGVHINIMQRHADDSCTVLYAVKCPKGDSFGRFTVAPAPSAATGKAAAAKDAEQWTKTPPTEQADYWHWNGDPDHAPMIYHVMWSGTAKKCFVSMGQYDIDEAIWCDNFGGWWLKIEQPSIPSDRAAIAASQKEETNRRKA